MEAPHTCWETLRQARLTRCNLYHMLATRLTDTLDHSLHGVHVNLQVCCLANHPCHEAGEVESGRQGEAGQAWKGRRH